MNSTIQSLIVGVILLIVVFYVIHKIFKMVRNRKSPTSACCGCNKPCKVEKIDKKRQKKNKLEYWKIEKYNIPLHSQSLKRIRVPWPSGQAPVCKTVYGSSILPGTSKKLTASELFYFLINPKNAKRIVSYLHIPLVYTIFLLGIIVLSAQSSRGQVVLDN